MARPRSSRPFDIWPGYVDALTSLLMVIIFLLMVFVLAQYFLGQTLSSKDTALLQLKGQIADLTGQLSLEKASSADLRRQLAQLSTALQSSLAERDKLAAQVGDSARNKAALDQASQTIAGQQSQLALLNQQIAALRQQLAALTQALDAADAKNKAEQAQIADLGKRLNVALATKVEELQRYRSEFYGKLREVLGNRPDIRVVGDRFVFQSEVLFDSGSAEIAAAGQIELMALAKTLLDISQQIPPNLQWILRVDGHTDPRPIHTPQFSSNWELSTARAIAVVKFLIAQGVPAKRLAATGFGEFQPIDTGTGEPAMARNRRIELRLTDR